MSQGANKGSPKRGQGESGSAAPGTSPPSPSGGSKRLCAYRWHGEQRLCNENIVWFQGG
jgi:hypothetical protein